jgi:hypothetical protein
MPTLPPHRPALHPGVWCLPVMALLAWAAMSVNGGFYEFVSVLNQADPNEGR